MATKTAKKVKTQKKSKNLKSTLKNIHDEALRVSDKLVEGSLATGAKWQTIMAKALTQGTVIFGKQQDLAIDTLTELKGQYVSGAKRFKKLVSLDLPKVKAVAKVKEVAKAKVVSVKTKVAKATPKKVQVVKAAAVKATKSTKVTKDNLKNIDGIGPKIATLLNQAGIMTFADLAKTNLKDIQVVLDAAGSRYKMHDPKPWVAQAKKLMK